MVLVRVERLHYTEVFSKQLIRQKFLKAEFSKSNQRWSTRWQKVRTKRQSDIWSRDSPTNPGFSLFIIVVKDNFVWMNNTLSFSDLTSAPNYSILNFGKRLNPFRWPNYVDTDKTLHNTKILQLKMRHCPVTKQLWLALYKLKCGLLSEWVTRANPIFFICLRVNKIRSLGQPWSSKVSTSFFKKLPRVLPFSVPLQNF